MELPFVLVVKLGWGLDCFMCLFCFSIFSVAWCFGLFSSAILSSRIYKTDLLVLTMGFSSCKYLDSIWFLTCSLVLTVLVFRLISLCFSHAEVSFDLIRLLGFQWYWLWWGLESFGLVFQCVESDLLIGDMRLLQTENMVFLFSYTTYKLWLTSLDVIHSFTLGTLSIKVDCIPGRSNEVGLCCFLGGVYYGQCSERVNTEPRGVY